MRRESWREVARIAFAVFGVLAWAYLTRHSVDSAEIAGYQPTTHGATVQWVAP